MMSMFQLNMLYILIIHSMVHMNLVNMSDM
jgi:hypothetical protein